ncbi:MAG: flavin reductase family protein [Flavobacteriales bacterium]
MNIDISNLAPAQIYHLMIQTVIPRPIAWVLTDSGEANYNLAPFSYFAPIGSSPPLLMFSAGKKPTDEVKDTVRNSLETKKMVIHIAAVGSAYALTQTSATLEHGQSEVADNELKLVAFKGFDMPRLEDCPIAFGCSLYEVKEIGDTPQSLVFAQIERVYLSPGLIDQKSERLKIDALSVNPLSRLGGSQYAVLGKTFAVDRPR